ncbi:MAG: hypothetical protein O7F08_07680 [Deltaproteobacteria bacterium]|nr:hypothetical protein [Deltaproteobacteria bacterium]
MVSDKVFRRRHGDEANPYEDASSKEDHQETDVEAAEQVSAETDYQSAEG